MVNVTLPKAIYRFNAISIKASMAFITELEKSILKFLQKHSLSLSFSNSQSNLSKMNKTGGITLPDFKIYYKAILIKTVCYCIKADIWINETELEVYK
jgi:hypothetical protein